MTETINFESFDKYNLPPLDRKGKIFIDGIQERVNHSFEFIKTQYPNFEKLSIAIDFIEYHNSDAVKADFEQLERVGYFPATETEMELDHAIKHALIGSYKAAFADLRRALELTLTSIYLTSEHITKIECVKMKPGRFGKDGRRIPVVIPDSNFMIEVDLAIPAVSQYSDFPFISKAEVGITDWGTFIVDPQTQMTTQPGVFAGGDVARGSDVVITAIADGKNAAKSIDKYLGGKGKLNTGEPIELPPKGQEEGNTIEHERLQMRYLDLEQRKGNFDEVPQGFHKLNAIAEAMRCLQCSRR